MTDKDKRSSTDEEMDGAVAAIRRILKAELAETPAPEEDDEEDDAFLLTRRMIDSDTDASEKAGDNPLVLTADMLANEKSGPPAEYGGGSAPVPAEPTERAVSREPLALDEAAVEKIARRIFREELTGAGAEATSADLRRVIRSEITRLLSG